MGMWTITNVRVGPKVLAARVVLAPGYPASTDADMEGTDRVVRLLPQVAGHTCIGPAGDTFGAALPSTSTAHLLEHVAVELMARADAAEVNSGNTWALRDPCAWRIDLTCPDDALTLMALGDAMAICDWAYAGAPAGAPIPDVGGMVRALRAL